MNSENRDGEEQKSVPEGSDETRLPEPKPAEPAPEPKLVEPAPEPKPAEPAPEPKPAEPAPEPKPAEPNRRQFLKVAAGAAAGTGVAALAARQLMIRPTVSDKINRLTEAQQSYKRKTSSPVCIIQCNSYDELATKQLKDYTNDLELPDVRGKKVLLKVNMVDYRPDRPLTTDPAAITAAVKLMSDCGAKEVIVGDASALNRDTEFLLKATGFGDCCKALGVRFVDLNIDDIKTIPNPLRLTKEKEFALPRSVADADVVVSMPKLKTHRWALVTCSLKNLFGALPGRVYGWPKNFLHVNGISESIMDLAIAIKPSFAIVDAVVCMEGHGPLDGTAKPGGFLVLGPDLAAVDAVCVQTMQINPTDVTYLLFAEKIVGNTVMENINLTGESIDSVKQEFQLPRTFQRENGKILNKVDQHSSASGVT